MGLGVGDRKPPPVLGTPPIAKGEPQRERTTALFVPVPAPTPDKVVVLGRCEKPTRPPLGTLDQLKLQEVGISPVLLLAGCGASVRRGEAAAKTAADTVSPTGCPQGTVSPVVFPRIKGVIALDAGVTVRSAAMFDWILVMSVVLPAVGLSNGVPFRETCLTIVSLATPCRNAGVIGRADWTLRAVSAPLPTGGAAPLGGAPLWGKLKSTGDEDFGT